MANSNKKPSSTPRVPVVRRRRPTLPSTKIVAEPDAINETLRASGHLQRQLYFEAEVRARLLAELNRLRQQLTRRARYRLRKKFEQELARQAGLPTLFPVESMSDQAVDAAIAQEEREAQFRANLPVISQGYDRPRINTDRLADQYAAVSNFYTALGSPSYMPMTDRLVRANPQVAQALLNFGLNNPAMTVMLTAAGTLLGNGVLNSAPAANAANALDMTMNAMARPATTLATNWAPKAVPVAKAVDAGVGTYIIGNGAVDMALGVINNDPSLTAHGALETMYGLPMLRGLKGAPALSESLSFTPNFSSRAGGFVNTFDNFIANPRTQAVGSSLGLGTLSAVANTEREPVWELDDDGYPIRDSQGNKVPKKDDLGNIMHKDPGLVSTVVNYVRDNPLDAAFYGYFGLRGARYGWNRWIGKPREPIEFTTEGPNGTRVSKRTPVGSRVKAPEYEPVEFLPDEAIPEGLVRPSYPNIPNKPHPEDFGIIAEPSMPRPLGFSENLLPDPGPRPTSGKKLLSRQRRWDRQNQQYQDQQARLQEYNAQNAEAELAWTLYNSPELVAARERYNLASSEYSTHEPEYQQALDQYLSRVDDYNSAYNSALQLYNNSQRQAFPNSEQYREWKTRDDLFGEYYQSPEYGSYLEALLKWQRRKAIPGNIWLYIRKHPFDVAIPTIWIGSKLFGGDSTTGVSTHTPQIQFNPVDTIGVVPGVRRDSVMNAVTDSLRSYGSRESAEPELADDED